MRKIPLIQIEAGDRSLYPTKASKAKFNSLKQDDCPYCYKSFKADTYDKATAKLEQHITSGECFNKRHNYRSSWL